MGRIDAFKICGGAALLLALAGCMKMDIDVALQPDDTVDGSVTVAIAKALAEMGEEDAETMAEEMRDDIMDSDAEFDEVNVEPYATDDFVGSTMHFEGGPLDLFADGEGDEGLKIERDGDHFVVTGAMDLTGEEGEQIEALGSAFDIRIAVTFPGPVAEHDGELDGTTVVWTPQVGERVEMNARGAAVGGGETAPDDGASGDSTGDATQDGTATEGTSATEGTETDGTSTDAAGVQDDTAAQDETGAQDDAGLSPIALVAIGLAALAALAVVAVLLLRRRGNATDNPVAAPDLEAPPEAPARPDEQDPPVPPVPPVG